MDGASMNHYEKQLYSVFKTFDVDNEEALDRSAVVELCDALQLEDRGAALVDTLFERRDDRVTFTQFRNGLLSVLGTEAPHAHPPAPPHSDDDSSGREVAPKFVVGSKKYGRRSRPPHPASDSSPRHRGASDSRLDGERARQRMRCKRSASAMESRSGSPPADDEDPADLDHERRVDREGALALCRTLRMRAVDRRTVERAFTEPAAADEMSVGEFFERLDAALGSTLAAPPEGAPEDEAIGEVVASEAVVEAWERAGVRRPRRLLAELGFAAAALRSAELERALDAELQALAGAGEERAEARALVALAAHAAGRLRREGARRRLEAAAAERDKLRADLAEANRRALLLAAEVDERQARAEAELAMGARAADARAAEAARAAAAEVAAERERSAATASRLQAELGRRADAEGSLRAEVAALRDQNEALQARTNSAEARATAAERAAARAAEGARAAGCAGCAGAAAAAEAARAEAREAAALAERLRRDNLQLRDRCDELAAALEAAPPRAAPAPPPACWRDEFAAHDRTEDSDSSPPGLGSTVLDHNDVLTSLRGVFDNVKTLPATGVETCESCSALTSALATIQARIREFEEAAQPAAAEPAALRHQLAAARRAHADDKENYSAVIKELESSLEQMKLEYDRCEEYWAGKLAEERELHAEEQRAGDERLADLAARIADYERQFAPPLRAHLAHHALPPIDERRGLEAQVTALEEEFAAYRAERDAELAAARDQLARLRDALDRLQHHQHHQHHQHQHDAGACGARAALGAREAAALRARAARAERAAQRLHARLAAADLLVKDLYVENCRLAHLPHAQHAQHAQHLP